MTVDLRSIGAAAQRLIGASARLLGLVTVLLLPAPVLAQTETVEYYALDAVGSVRVVFNPDGTVKGRMDYMPFGAELQPAVALPPEAFAGLFRDPEAGLDYARARSYQVRTGRFNRPDPVYAGLFNPQGWNRYSYALNDPLGYVDPTGLTPQSCSGVTVQGGDGRKISTSIKCGSSGEGSTDDDGGDDPGPEITVVIDIGGIFALPQFNPGGSSTGHTGTAPPGPGVTPPPAGPGPPGPTPPGPTPPGPPTPTIIDQARRMACSVLPTGRQTSIGGAVGGLGSTSGNVSVVVDYNTGMVTLTTGPSGTAGWNGVLSATVSTGVIWGGTPGVPSASATLGAAARGKIGIGAFAQRGGGSTSLNVSASVGLMRTPTGGISGAPAPRVLGVGTVLQGGHPVDVMLTVTRVRLCRL